MMDRSATDTIKGYFYQFDYSIEQLLSLSNDTDEITVEGIEDIDIESSTESTAVQCKYYSKSEYNHSVISKLECLPLVRHFIFYSPQGIQRYKFYPNHSIKNDYRKARIFFL